MATILIVDDEDKYLELCRRHLPEHDFIGPARNFREASRMLGRLRGRVDLVLLDVHFDIPADDLLPVEKGEFVTPSDRDRGLERLRRSQGLYILDALRPVHPDLPVIVMTSREDLPIEADSERLNAEDYTYLLDDEYLDARSLKLQIDGILARARPQADADDPFFWGTTSTMAALRRRVAVIARGQLPIIIQGETGTGKSLLARDFIHGRSGRSGAFVAVDLSTIPADLMAAHLFGVVKGAYTGATQSREGVLARADGGTLFLDEIGNLSLELQKSLLLVLQEQRYRPVGSTEERSVDVKLVVATNEHLASAVRHGRFREDLYMRLNPATAVTLPSLRERRDDFSHVLDSFVGRVCASGYNRELLLQYAQQRGLAPSPGPTPFHVTIGRKVPARVDRGQVHFLLHANSLRLLSEFDWPGNFRQLEMVLSNLLTFTLVDLVDRVDVEPISDVEAARPDLVPIHARTVAELLRPFEVVAPAPTSAAPAAPALGDDEVIVRLRPAESLNAVSCAVERQYLEAVYQRHGGDLGRVAQALLGDEAAGRKIQLRMNQLGVKLRQLRKGGPRGDHGA